MPITRRAFSCTVGLGLVELDRSPDMPMTARDAATIAKAYLSKQGVSLRS